MELVEILSKRNWIWLIWLPFDLCSKCCYFTTINLFVHKLAYEIWIFFNEQRHCLSRKFAKSSRCDMLRESIPTKLYMSNQAELTVVKNQSSNRHSTRNFSVFLRKARYQVPVTSFKISCARTIGKNEFSSNCIALHAW